MMDPRLDALLAELPTERPSAALTARVLAAAPKPRRERAFGFDWRWGAGLAAAGVAGLVFGAASAVSVEVGDGLALAAVPYEAVLADAEGEG